MKISKFCVVAASLTLIASACGDDDADSDSASSTAAPAVTSSDEASSSASAEPTAPEPTTAAPESSSAEATGTADGEALTYNGWEADLEEQYAEPDSCGTVGNQFPTLALTVGVISQQAFESQVERLGGTPISLDDQVDPTKQVSNFQIMRTQNAEAIGVYPLDPATLGPVLRQADEDNLPIIVQDFTFGETASADYPFDSQITAARDYSAFYQAQYVADKKPGAKVGIIGLSVPVPGLVYMREQQEYWANEFGLEVVGVELQDTDDEAGGQEAMTTLLAKQPDIEAVISYNDLVAIGAEGAARAAGKDVVSVGMNGNAEAFEAIRTGGLDATFLSDSVNTGVALANGLCTLSIDPDAEVPEALRARIVGPIDSSNVDSTDDLQTIYDKTFGGA